MNRTPLENPCDRARKNLDAYVDRELAEAPLQQLREHLKSCGACRTEVEARTAWKARVRGAVRAQQAPPELAVKVRRQLSQSATQPWWHWAGARTPAWVLSVATFAVLVTGVWVSRPVPLPAIGDRPAQNEYIRRISTSVPGTLRPGLADHVHCAVFRKYPAEPPSAAVMLAELGDFHELLPAIRATVPESWRVLMAHQCSYMGRKYIHVTLREGERLLSLVVARKQEGEGFGGLRPAATIKGVQVYQGKADRYQVAGFAAGGYLAYFVSDGGDQRNLAIVSLLTESVSRVLAEIL